MVSCQLYDYIEIACLYRIPVDLTLVSDALVEGIAVDTCIELGAEFMVLDHLELAKASDEPQRLKIDISTIKIMAARVKNPHFDQVNFIEET
ncbi:Uncharacterised protein [BD1-7 clade bacterium]|uniref:Transcriptional antiterminator n=1 Tax=BD1-7 clade bacterium TaxID=2029982 RepID=A0A5S9QVX8_9GAMM|nr:Uncharacterised protein [BD1-7 clade bacterium]